MGMHELPNSTINQSASTMSPPPSNHSKMCLNDEVITPDFIIGFAGLTNATLLVCTLASAALQLHVLSRAYRHIRGKTPDKCLHVFLFSMTLSDFIITGICYPVEFAPRTNLIPPLPRLVNQSMHILLWVSLIVSSISLVLMNADKLFYFRFPLRYSQYFTRRRSVWISVALWVFATAFVLVAWLFKSFVCVNEDCTTLGFANDRVHVYIMFIMLASLLPTLTSLTVALYILKIMTIHRQQISQEQLLCSPNAAHVRQNSVFAQRIRTFYFIFMTTIFTALTLLPYRLISIQRVMNPVRTPECVSVLVLWALVCLMELNSIINPLLTVTILPQYRIHCFQTYKKQIQFTTDQTKLSGREPDSARESI